MIVFDLDGTLALCDHRRWLVEGPYPNWPAFFAACGLDIPNSPVIRLFEQLVALGEDVEIWSGRPDEVKPETEEWLREHTIYRYWVVALRMRPSGDTTPDERLKAAWLQEVRAEGRRVELVFDDRDKVVNMWREQGITCLQVARGDF